MGEDLLRIVTQLRKFSYVNTFWVYLLRNIIQLLVPQLVIFQVGKVRLLEIQAWFVLTAWNAWTNDRRNNSNTYNLCGTCCLHLRLLPITFTLVGPSSKTLHIIFFLSGREWIKESVRVASQRGMAKLLNKSNKSNWIDMFKKQIIVGKWVQLSTGRDIIMTPLFWHKYRHRVRGALSFSKS